VVRAIGCDREIELVVDLLIGRSIRPSRQAFFTRAVSERVIDFIRSRSGSRSISGGTQASLNAMNALNVCGLWP